MKLRMIKSLFYAFTTIREDDGINYVECINSHAPFDETCLYPANKTYVGVVPGIIIQL